VNILYRGNTHLRSFTLNLQTMLVTAGQKKDVFALGTMITGHGIGDSRTVSMTDMQFIAGIIDRGGDIKRWFCHMLIASSSEINLLYNSRLGILFALATCASAVFLSTPRANSSCTCASGSFASCAGCGCSRPLAMTRQNSPRGLFSCSQVRH